MDGLFDFSQPIGQVVAAILFLIPGLNATWIIERLAGRTSLSGTERLLRGVALSVLVYGIGSPWLLRLAHRVLEDQKLWPWEPIIGLSVLIFVAPVALGLVWTQIQKSGRARKVIRRLTNVDRFPTSWDYVFSKGGPFFIRMKLKTGERVGGAFGPDSNASF